MPTIDLINLATGQLLPSNATIEGPDATFVPAVKAMASMRQRNFMFDLLTSQFTRHDQPTGPIDRFVRVA